MFNPQISLSSKLDISSETQLEMNENDVFMHWDYPMIKDTMIEKTKSTFIQYKNLIKPSSNDVKSSTNLSAPRIELNYLRYYTKYIICIEWEDVPGAIFYDVYRSNIYMENLTSFSPIRSLNYSQYSESISNPGFYYYYLVVAIGDNEESAASNQVAFFFDFDNTISTTITTSSTYPLSGSSDFPLILIAVPFMIGLILVISIVISRVSSHIERLHRPYIPETIESAHLSSYNKNRETAPTMNQPMNQRGIRFCRQCGFQNNSFSNYCSECGSKLY